jgi:hypothetical protein
MLPISSTLRTKIRLVSDWKATNRPSPPDVGQRRKYRIRSTVGAVIYQHAVAACLRIGLSRHMSTREVNVPRRMITENA